MSLDFPNSPTVGQTYTGPNNVMWQWDGTKWVAGYGSTSAYAPVNSPTFTGDPQAPTPSASDADASIATTAFVAPGWNNAGRNLIHNGMFNIQQRGVGAWSTSGSYTADRWKALAALDSISFGLLALSDANRAQIGDEAATHCMSMTFTGNAGASSFTVLAQTLEGIRRFGGKTITLSFYGIASVGGMKIGANFLQSYGTGGSPTADGWVQATGGSATLTAGWARYSMTFTLPSLAGRTLGTDGNDCLVLWLWLSSGSANNALSGNVGVQSGTIQLWGVQLEIGSVATPLEKRDPEIELSNCLRFYERMDYNNSMVGLGTSAATPMPPLVQAVMMRLKVRKRAQPTVVASDVSSFSVAGVPCTSFSFGTTQDFIWASFQAASGSVGGWAAVYVTGNTGAYIAVSADL